MPTNSGPRRRRPAARNVKLSGRGASSGPAREIRRRGHRHQTVNLQRRRTARRVGAAAAILVVTSVAAVLGWLAMRPARISPPTAPPPEERLEATAAAGYTIEVPEDEFNRHADPEPAADPPADRTPPTPRPTPVPSQPDGRIPGAIWQMGRLNGRPAKPTDAFRPQEYSRYRSQTTPVKLAADDSLQVLQAEQSLVIQLPELPARDLLFRLVLNTGVPMEVSLPWATAKQPEFVQILFNDEILHYRWQAKSSNWVDVYLPADRVLESDNRLAIRSIAGKDWGIDAAWIEPAQPGSKLWLALAEADWLDADHARYIPQMGVSRYPYLPALAAEELTALKARKPIRIGTIAYRQNRWRAGRYGTRSAAKIFDDPKLQRTFNQWREQIDRALMRGAEPVLEVSTHSSPRSGWLRLFVLFSPFVRDWIIACHSTDGLAELMTTMKGISPDARVAFVNLPEHPYPIDALKAGRVALRATTNATITENLNRFRQALLRQGITRPQAMEPWLQAYFLNGISGLYRNCRGGVEIARMCVSFLHAGGGGIYLHGGRVGGGVFPVGAERPGYIWDMLELLLPLGRGQARRLPANLIPYDSNVGLFDAAWCAVQNSSEQVTLVAYARADCKRTVSVECRVPWPKAETVVEIKRLQMLFDSTPRREPTETVELTTEGDGNHSVARFRCRLASLVQIRLRPQATRTFVEQHVVSKYAEDRVSIERREQVFEPGDDRPLKHHWLVAINQGEGWSDFEAYGPESTATRQVATPGRIGKEKNAVPWYRQSTLVSFAPTEETWKRPNGMAVYFNLYRYRQAEDVAFWVYPRSTNGASSVTLLVGSKYFRTRVRLRTNQWQCLRAPVDRIREKHQKGAFYLRIWPVKDECRKGNTVSFEINAIHGIGRYVKEEIALDRDAQVIRLRDSKASADYVLLARPDRAAMVHTPLPTGWIVKDVTSDCPDLVTRLLPAAGKLRVAMETVPAESSIPKELLKELPAEVRTRIRNGERTAIAFSLKR